MKMITKHKKENKKIGIFPFRKYEGKAQVGSSIIRCDWLLNYWPEAEQFRYGQPYETIIYQKVYFPEHPKIFKGVKILDLVDPDWMHWGYRTKEMIEEMDAVTCSSLELIKAVAQFTNKPVVYIPDRVDIDLFKPKRRHKNRASRVAWFGYSHNFTVLDPVINYLIKHNLELKIISEKNYLPPAGTGKLKYDVIPFKWKNIEHELKWADFVVNPKLTTGKWKYKSDNKTIISWALGLPVAKSSDDIERFMDPEEREKEAKIRYKEVKEKFDVKQSIDQYKQLIQQIKRQNNDDKFYKN